MVKRRAFTLLEMIFVVVLSAVLSLGAFKAVEALYLRAAKAKAVTLLSLQSQIVLDQIAQLLYQRIPGTAIGYSPSEGVCEPIDALTESRPVLEWIAMDEENLVARKYDGFADVEHAQSRKSSRTLVTPGIDDALAGRDLVFAGAMEAGEEGKRACAGAYGWHGNDRNATYTIDSIDANKTTFKTDSSHDKDTPEIVYEKYYLAQTAYAVTRSKEIDKTAACIARDTGVALGADDNDTLLLFYNYRPWAGETFCADPSGGGQEGNVTILARHVAGFEAEALDGVIRLKLDMSYKIRTLPAVHITKQKAVF